MKAVFVLCGCGAVANAAALAAKQQSFTPKVSALNVLATLTSAFIFRHHVCLRVHGSLFGLSGRRLLVLFGFACPCVRNYRSMGVTNGFFPAHFRKGKVVLYL